MELARPVPREEEPPRWAAAQTRNVPPVHSRSTLLSNAGGRTLVPALTAAAAAQHVPWFPHQLARHFGGA
jgi:hypothetical protein